ncbi:MAG: hypothetical protein H6513_04725 [Acidimicrobiaceae bacterium]|nr:hypothetical protein [Acidimicrobiaceae bacterium]MCO5330631.1 hypothetical protein [Ilumatobacteraceae bacterium]
MPPRRAERPRTAAEQRAAEVNARRAPRPPRDEQDLPPREREPWVREEWIDEGEVRDAAERAAARAGGTERPASRRRKEPEVAPEVEGELSALLPAARVARYQERLASAAEALDRGRYGDARRMVQPVLRDVPDIAFAHELAGLASYRLGHFRKAASELEEARRLDGTIRHHAVLADCYRAMRRYHEVETLWAELRDASPEPALMAEGRIVAAGALADRGDLSGALEVMRKAMEVPKRVRDYHLRQWYVVGDLLDRSGDIVTARRWFSLVAQADPAFADVVDRLRSLGR